MAKKKELKISSIDFSQLVGLDAVLYQCNDLYRFQLGALLFEVVENESDGYRSSMQEVRIVNENVTTTGRIKLEKIVIENSKEFDGFKLVGKPSGHIWLEFGTDNSDSYYPSFVYRWTPLETDEFKEIKKRLLK